jgi:hypothetical protein
VTAREDGSGPRPATERADEMLSVMGRGALRLFSRTVARTREEVEDMWAEAQALRRSAASQPSERRDG